MRIAVLGDTHGNIKQARQLVETLGEVEMLLHTGDFLRDAQLLAAELDLPYRAVAGNCDLLDRGSAEEIFKLAGRRILLVHGHRYRVKFGLLNLFYRAQETGADLVIFGHTHQAIQFWQEGMLFVNPGSAGCPDAAGRVTAALIELGATIDVEMGVVPDFI